MFFEILIKTLILMAIEEQDLQTQANICLKTDSKP